MSPSSLSSPFPLQINTQCNSQIDDICLYVRVCMLIGMYSTIYTGVVVDFNNIILRLEVVVDGKILHVDYWRLRWVEMIWRVKHVEIFSFAFFGFVLKISITTIKDISFLILLGVIVTLFFWQKEKSIFTVNSTCDQVLVCGAVITGIEEICLYFASIIKTRLIIWICIWIWIYTCFIINLNNPACRLQKQCVIMSCQILKSSHLLVLHTLKLKMRTSTGGGRKRSRGWDTEEEI